MADGTRQMAALDGFAAGPDTQRQLRSAFGRFATGVTVVTAQTPDGPIGMTANSFSSVSLDPPLVLWCPAKSSTRYAHFIAAQHFAIHVLGTEQEEIALGFAKSGTAFDGLDVTQTAEGVPLLGDCLARFECTTDQIHDAGDHAIVVGRVRAAAFREGDALIFCQGRFTRFDNQA
ncbi:flavin reductase family protein [Roseobacter sinensis]|uniref:Flavin reductase family protein n=1 Tax=Roseobacter sinensis TaxID=2931391 RepID=A0ABT3BKA7_9RHOB|nr:flavin reductase family protein [Roseobacter sp. WL0113]MCV3273996.1 flavin reductase family protein [Roseobacter sp. WL0113]